MQPYNIFANPDEEMKVSNEEA